MVHLHRMFHFVWYVNIDDTAFICDCSLVLIVIELVWMHLQHWFKLNRYKCIFMYVISDWRTSVLYIDQVKSDFLVGTTTAS